jgi:hypothetical protein
MVSHNKPNFDVMELYLDRIPCVEEYNYQRKTQLCLF